MFVFLPIFLLLLQNFTLFRAKTINSNHLYPKYTTNNFVFLWLLCTSGTFSM